MAKAKRWVVWTLRPSTDARKKPSKVPTGNPTDPTSWGYFPTARSCLEEEKIAGLGFEMWGRPEVVGIDIDNCIDEIGNRSALAQKFLGILQAAKVKCHVEISPSGKGLRVFAAETPLPFHDFTNHESGVEVYTGESGRFLAFTGAVLPEWIDVGGPFDPLPEEAVTWLGKHALRWKEGREGDQLRGVGPVHGEAEPLPDLSRREDWKDLYPKTWKRLSKDHKEFIETGAIGSKYSSASEHLFAVEQRLLALGLKPPQAYQVLLSAEGSWQVALEHRENKNDRAKEFLWEDLQRAAKAKIEHEKDRAAQDAGWKDCDIIVEVDEEGAHAKWLAKNIYLSFLKHPEWVNRLGYNTFDGKATLDREDISSKDLIEMSAWLVEFLQWSSEPRREVFEEAMIEAAKTRPWNPIEVELRGYVWDGRPRLKKFVEAICGDRAEPVDSEILKKWLIAFVARGIEPGCQMDTILSLYEEEGGGFKTTFCRVMAGSRRRFSDTPGFQADRESSMLREGKRIVELGEGVAARKADRAELKRDVTKREDEFRRPWGRGVELRPRGSVYVATVNTLEWLRADQDGLRRVWPVYCQAVIDIEWVTENREQLLAEAVRWYDAKERWWWGKGEEPEALKLRQGEAVSEDTFDAPVLAVISDPENAKRGYTTLTQIKVQVEAIAGIQIGAATMQHLIDICHKHGLRSERERRLDGKKVRPWIHKSWRPVSEGKIVWMPEAPSHGVSGRRTGG